MAAWKSVEHLEDHYEFHRRELRVRSIAEYDASAQETIALSTRFSYRDRGTGESRLGYFHRDSSRFVATDLAGYIVTHFQTDEFYVVTLPRSTYQD
jgi:hypothetical protein